MSREVGALVVSMDAPPRPVSSGSCGTCWWSAAPMLACWMATGSRPWRGGPRVPRVGGGQVRGGRVQRAAGLPAAQLRRPALRGDEAADSRGSRGIKEGPPYGAGLGARPYRAMS